MVYWADRQKYEKFTAPDGDLGLFTKENHVILKLK